MCAQHSDKKGQENSVSDAARHQALARIRAAQSQRRTPEHWAQEIQSGNRDALSQAITLTESQRLEDLEYLTAILQALDSLPLKGRSNAFRIGITGVPGVGKSTFIEQFGQMLIEDGHRVAVLAIDPSSARTHGSLLGDKTRMEALSRSPQAFVRPSPTASNLGGVARGTHEAILLCEAAGYDRIIVETVGVGQSETEVRNLTDAFVLLMLPGGGDELQGIKRGIMEMADLILVNKDDGPSRAQARETAAQYQQALHLFPPTPGGHTIRVLTASALESKGIRRASDAVEELIHSWRKNKWFEEQRQQQRLHQLDSHINTILRLQRAHHNDGSATTWDSLRTEVLNGTRHPLDAAQYWLKNNAES